MFETGDLKREARSQFKRATSNLKKEIEQTAKRKLPFTPRNKIRLYNSTRRVGSSLYIPRVYMRSFREGATPVVTLGGASKLRLPQITTTAQLARVMSKDKRLHLSKNKDYVLCYQAGKRTPVYQIDNKRNTKSLLDIASEEFKDLKLE